MVELADLFPNSSDKCLARLKAEPLTENQKNALAHLEPIIHAVDRASIPIAIGMGIMKETNGRVTYSVQITRGNGCMETGHDQRKNRVEFEIREWKHVLLGHDKPNIMDYPDDPEFKEIPYR